ncbi:MAG: substrate-binding domain-containing protein [Planctomycetia bacterium]|nr:substrate-binding domain-containing protein [Planctomycetia bacterium]
MKNRKFLIRTGRILFLLLMLPLFLFAGCEQGTVQSKTPPQNKEIRRGTIAVSYINGKNKYFPTLANAIEAKAKEKGYGFIAQDAQLDPERQIRQINRFIEDKVAAIVLLPTDSVAVGPSVRKANQAGIPVFTADVAVHDPFAKIVCHIATDNYSGGKLAAIQMLEALGRKGKVAIVDDPGLESVQLRTRGFREVIAFANQEGAQIEIVSAMPGYGSEEKSILTAREILNDHSDIDGIFAINAPTCLGVLKVLRERGLDKKIKIVSFDGAEEIKVLVDQGIVYSDIIQLPKEIGEKTFDCLHEYLNGKMILSQILFATSVYSRQNGEQKNNLKGGIKE